MRLTTLIVFISVGLICFGQGFRSRIYLPGVLEHRTQAIFPVPGNKYIGTGFSLENINGKQVNRLTILGLDSLGKPEWVKKYGDTSIFYYTNSFISRAFIFYDGHVYYAGCARDNTNKQVGVFTKINLQGDTVWQKIYRDPDPLEDVIPQMVAPAVDGGFLITGFFQHWGQHYRKCLLIKTDAMGNELWRKKIDKLAPHTQDGRAIVQDSSSKKIVIAGYQYAPGGQMNDNILVVDSLGNKLHQRTYVDGSALDLIQHSSKKMIVAGQAYMPYNGGGDGSYVAAFDHESPAVPYWSTVMKNDFYNHVINSIRELHDGTVLASQGRDSFYNPDNNSVAYLKFSQNGTLFWEKQYEYRMKIISRGSVELTYDGGWVTAYPVVAHNAIDPFFFVKYDSNGCDSTLAYCALVSALEENAGVLPGVYPIPCNDVLHIKNTTGDLSGKLFDGTGRLCRQFQLSIGDETATIQTTGLTSGVYLLRIKSGDHVLTKKVVVQH